MTNPEDRMDKTTARKAEATGGLCLSLFTVLPVSLSAIR